MSSSTTLRELDKDFVSKQTALGAQSCRGLSGPDFSALRSSEHAQNVFKQMLAREQTMAGEWACFYHSYNSPALIYETQAAIAKVLFKFGAKYGVLPRLLKKPFEKLPDADAVLKAFPSWHDRDHNVAFKRVGICCSTSLFSRDPEATPTQVFLGGYGASSVGIEVVQTLLKDCGTPPAHVPRLAQQVMDLAAKFGLPQATGGSSQGHMLQIFIHRGCVDKWAYASLPFGVLDKPRQPLSKSMSRSGVIVGQARVIVNPSAFMRAGSVRLHVCSADATYHKNRAGFQDALFDALAPILGSADVRQEAAKGVYGGRLPSWWRDVESENQNVAATSSRTCCRYAAECRHKGRDHRREYAHPGDPDWVSDADVNKTETKSERVRSRCRFGAECRRTSDEHRCEFAHPDDRDWDSCEAKESNEIPLRSCCRFGADCYRKGADHRREFSHPGDIDWDKAVKATAADDANSSITESTKEEGKPMDVSAHPDKHKGDSETMCDTSNEKKLSKAEAKKAVASNSVDDAKTDNVNFKLSPKWLASLPPAEVSQLRIDLKFMVDKFGLEQAVVADGESRSMLVLEASSVDLLEAAKNELTQTGGLLEFYMTKATVRQETSGGDWDQPPATPQLRVDPENGRVWAWDTFSACFEGEYTRAEVKEYWQTMPAASKDEVAPCPKASSSRCREAGA